MADSTITVHLNCPCGGVLQTEEDSPTDESVVSCKECGNAYGTYGEVVAHAKKLATDRAREIVATEFKKALGGLNRKITIKL